jgi:hypothetical protein
MSSTRNVLAAFAALTAATATASGAVDPINPGGAPPNIQPSPVVPSPAFTSKFIGSLADNRSEDEMRVAQTWPGGPPKYLKMPYPPTPGPGPIAKSQGATWVNAPKAMVIVPHFHAPGH